MKVMIMACVSQGVSGIQIRKKRNPHCSGVSDAAIGCSDGVDLNEKVAAAVQEKTTAKAGIIFQYLWISVNQEFVVVCQVICVILGAGITVFGLRFAW